MAKNKDRALRYEQTFDIINLDNKLKGLEGLPGYPEEKPPNYKNRNLGNNSKTPYNIISCLDFADHHYLPPEQRPPRLEEKPRTYKINVAEQYWKTHDYDIFNCKFIDPHKEEEVSVQNGQEIEKVAKKKYEKLPNGIKYSEGALYQAISMKIVDPERLYEIDVKSKQAKQRYENRYDIEKEYHDRDIEYQEKSKIQAVNRIAHERYTENIERGYDILSHSPFQGRGSKVVYPSLTKPKPTIWERALSQKSEGPPQSAPMNSRFSTPSRTIRSSGFKIVS